MITVCFVGYKGSGKTTLAKLLAISLPPTRHIQIINDYTLLQQCHNADIVILDTTGYVANIDSLLQLCTLTIFVTASTEFYLVNNINAKIKLHKSHKYKCNLLIKNTLNNIHINVDKIIKTILMQNTDLR